MQIRLKNIGIVKDSTIILDGLTVITGKNNSGKTTVGKALYSLLDAVANIQRKAENDRCVYVINYLNNFGDTLEFLRYFRNLAHTDEPDIFTTYPVLKSVITREYRREISPDTMEDLVHRLIDELKNLDTSFFVDQIEMSRNSRVFRIKALDSQKDSLKASFDRQKTEAIFGLEKLLSQINKDPELINYARESINHTLRIEFSNQIQPVKGQEEPSEIELSDSDKVYFHLAMEDNLVADDGAPIFTISPCRKVYLVDDPFILDDEPTPRYLRGRIIEERDSFFNPGRIVSHRDTTMLILDEPEAHLHPKWQNAFAEIIVLLVKELNVNVLLTTHSSNFMLALDAYMRKYEIAEKTNFYQTDILGDGFVQYRCVNNDMGMIYQDFLQYLSEVKMLRNKYLTKIEE